MNVVDVTERLMAEFEDRLGLKHITDVVRTCRRDLDGMPTGALPELVERLARQRLLDLINGDAAEPQPDRVIHLP